MAKIVRKTSQLFAVSAPGTGVEQFASFEVNGAPTYTTDPAVIQAAAAWGLGWSASQFQGTFAPYFQDRNGVDLVALYQLSYVLQQGIGEWDTATVYFRNSIVSFGGKLYVSLQDFNQGNAPPLTTNSFWTNFIFTRDVAPATLRVFASGSGLYTPPSGCVRIDVRLVGGGASGCVTIAGFASPGNDGTATTFGSIVCSPGRGGVLANPTNPGGLASGGDVNIQGGSGGANFQVGNSEGGISKFGGNGVAKLGGSTAVDAQPNSGSGGGGISTGPNVAFGGGAGGYAEATLEFPPNSTSYSYSVGVGGAAITFGGFTSGAGGSGIILIREYYF